MKIPKGERKKLSKDNKDWKTQAVSYSCDILFGTPIITKRGSPSYHVVQV